MDDDLHSSHNTSPPATPGTPDGASLSTSDTREAPLVRDVVKPRLPRPKNALAIQGRLLKLAGRPTDRLTDFEDSVALSVAAAVHRALKVPQADRFMAVSAPTGGGKTTAALSTMIDLYQQGGRVAYVAPTVELCQAAYEHLSGFVSDDDLAIYTHIHKEGASKAALALARIEKGIEVTRPWNEDKAIAAPVLIVTHHRWARDITGSKNLGIIDRDLIIVDEEPRLDVTFTCQPEDVSRLMSVIMDANAKSHLAKILPQLHAIHDRMRNIKDAADKPQIRPTKDLLTVGNWYSISKMLDHQTLIALSLSHGAEGDLLDSLINTVSFLKAAARGRVFYSKDRGGAFYAWDSMINPQPRHVLLDGTADLNYLAVSQNVEVVDDCRPDYRNLTLTHVLPPKEFRDYLKPSNGYIDSRTALQPYWAWVKKFMLDHTKPGDHVLVYAKQKFVEKEVHKNPDDGIADPYTTVWEGRTFHFVHFGRGRGLNKWRHCTKYFRLSEFFPNKGHTLAKLGSIHSEHYTPAELNHLSSPKARNARWEAARDAWINTHSKQDLARTAIRNLDDFGIAEAVDAYLIDSPLAHWVKYQHVKFPGSPPMAVMGHQEVVESNGSTSGPDALVSLLVSTAKDVLLAQEVLELTGVRPNNIDKTLRGSKVAPVAEALGWRKAKATAVLGKGAGRSYVLVRDTHQGPNVHTQLEEQT